MLERPHARTLHHFDHFRSIALLAETTGTGFTAVARRDEHGGFGDIGEGRIPGYPVEVVQEAAVKLVLALHIGRQLGGAVVHPLLPTLPHQRTLQTIGAVHATVEGEAFQAHARIVRERSAVAIEVFIGLVVVVLLNAHDDAVPDERADATAVGVVR